ncbi:hypothetical protein BCR37DRAFT_411774 [Protomyces lactucae-debilis]|uniref:Uncharacterized protein n=1 Tax=Protomyces lactucae-debilis TaxID=2754530 RepID=A0A1Y2FST6_PROLT|nr:uncharacterized protein BCR37DRAFT_411774 [Protomyces lactucae-debilis]ORY86999.1 hypothetical protein BCR37DRAFT_411774 [Protomyces lactucae-debilis]
MNKSLRAASIRLRPSSRSYARAVGGILNQPPPSAPSPQTSYEAIGVGSGRRTPTPISNALAEINNAAAAQGQLASAFGRKQELDPVMIATDDPVHRFLSDHVLADKADMQHARPLDQLLLDLDRQAGMEIPHVLPNGNGGNKATLETIGESVVTLAHILPARLGKSAQVVLASGFAILDGEMIVSCAHPFHQIDSHCRSYDAREQQGNRKAARTVAITHDGRILPITGVASHLVNADLVVLSVPKESGLKGLRVDPYPVPQETALHVFSQGQAKLVPSSHVAGSSKSGLRISRAWSASQVTVYQDRSGREAQTGTYDTLNSVLFTGEPVAGSSGGPILSQETKAVVGIIRGSEFSYAVRKTRGFGTPAETLFHAFKLM